MTELSTQMMSALPSYVDEWVTHLGGFIGPVLGLVVIVAVFEAALVIARRVAGRR